MKAKVRSRVAGASGRGPSSSIVETDPFLLQCLGPAKGSPSKDRSSPLSAGVNQRTPPPRAQGSGATSFEFKTSPT